MSNKRVKVFAVAVLAALMLAAFAPPADANSVTLTLSAVAGASGDTVTVDGTITNNTANTVYLNGENFSFGWPYFLNGDTTDFFDNAPFSLAAGGSSGSIALFTFDIAPATPTAIFTGNFLDIIGGTNSFDFTDVLTSSQFFVSVGGATPAPTPEPETLILLGTGFIFAAIFLRRGFCERRIQQPTARNT